MRANGTARPIPPPVPARRHMELMRQSSPTGLRREQSTADLMPQSSPMGVRPAALLSRETDPEFFALFNGHDNPFQSDNDSEDDRAFVASHAIAELEERMLQRQGSSAVIARIDEDSWGGIEEFSGYLTEYEDDGDEPEDSLARRKLTRRDPPPETINHLLLLPGSVGGGARPGWMHQAATYLLLRNETLFFFDAWMGTMAATVTFLLGQPDVCAGWVQDELARVQGAFSAVYRNDNCEQFWTYCGAIGDYGTFRTALLTQSAGDPRTWMRCPHLTKPVFAMWKLIQTKEAAFTKEQLRDRQLAFLVEFFHRGKVALQWDCPTRVSTRDWLDARSLLEIKDPLSYGVTLPEARKAYLSEIQVALRDLAKPEEIVPGEPQINMRGVDSASHFQFTVASIGQIFVNLARLAGIPDFDPKVAPRRLATLLQVASIGENNRRAAMSFFVSPMTEVQFRKVGTRKAMGLFKSCSIALADATFCYEYKEALRLAHREMPKTVPAGHAESFKAKWGVDVAAKLGLRKCGLSSVACMSPGCPYFLLPMNTPACMQGEPRIGCRLWLHHQPLQVIPGLHKSVQRVINEGRAENIHLRDAAAYEILKGVDLKRCSPSADRRHQEYVEALARLRKRPNLTPGRRAELERVVKDNFEKSSELALREYVARLTERMDEALSARGFGEVGPGKDYVSGRILRIAHERDAWDYSDFEAAVLSSMMVRSQATGRFAVVARP